MLKADETALEVKIPCLACSCRRNMIDSPSISSPRLVLLSRHCSSFSYRCHCQCYDSQSLYKVWPVLCFSKHNSGHYKRLEACYASLKTANNLIGKLDLYSSIKTIIIHRIVIEIQCTAVLTMQRCNTQHTKAQEVQQIEGASTHSLMSDRYMLSRSLLLWLHCSRQLKMSG